MPKAKHDHTLTAEQVRERLDYDPMTGALTWRAYPGMSAYSARWVGNLAGKAHFGEFARG